MGHLCSFNISKLLRDQSIFHIRHIHAVSKCVWTPPEGIWMDLLDNNLLLLAVLWGYTPSEHVNHSLMQVWKLACKLSLEKQSDWYQSFLGTRLFASFLRLRRPEPTPAQHFQYFHSWQERIYITKPDSCSLFTLFYTHYTYFGGGINSFIWK